MSAPSPRDTAAIELREATADDVPLLAEMNARLIEDEGSDNEMGSIALQLRMAEMLTSIYTGYVFARAGVPLGYAIVRDSEIGIHIRQFYVERAERKNGVGRAAFEALRARLPARGVALTLEVLTHNARAQAFWEAMGFQPYAISMRRRE